VKGLDLGALLWLRLADCGRLALRNGLASCIGYDSLGGRRNGLAGVDVVDGGKAAGEDSGSYGYDMVLARLNCVSSTTKECIPVRLRARRLNARVQAMVVVCGVESVGSLGDQDVAFIEVVRGKWRPIIGKHKSANESGHSGLLYSDSPRHHRRERQDRAFVSRKKFRQLFYS
jgi:hypothetical protein